ncbi:unnamed protein product [Ambrosiozyma monospora]|uniref:Unnamed protein product n=1 Tax=Ambrosiozyma monospora TaxID=43982 RepID=A0A9W6YY55_AMBMO|nr:unnamed protein product [Ambrosiozyma monospora]
MHPLTLSVSVNPIPLHRAGETQEEKASESEVKGDFTVHKLTEEVEVKTGEEEEDVMYVKRSKISKINNETNQSESVGLGDLKVLKHKVTGKARIVVRALNSGNVLLNTAVTKASMFTIAGGKQNIVIIPNITPQGLERYYAMVKTANDAKALVDALEKVK